MPLQARGPSRRTILGLGLGAAFVPMAPAIVRAQASDLPSGPIKVILPTASGGQGDTIGRLIGDRVGPAINRTFVMEPRPGAGGLIAGEYVARRGARRQHAAVRHRWSHHPAGPLRQDHQVRRRQGLRVRLPAYRGELRDRGQRRPSGKVVQRHPRNVTARSRQGHVQQHGRRLDAAPDRRGDEAALRRGVDPRALCGRRHAAQRRDGRTRRHVDQLDAHHLAAGAERPDARDRRHLGRASTAAAGHAVVRRTLAGLLGRHHSRSRGAGEDTARASSRGSIARSPPS